jgi:hypothetical protein
MWIGAIRLTVETGNTSNAGTDNLVQAAVLRDGTELRLLNLGYPAENGVERSAVRNYDSIGPTRLPRRNDQTPELPPGVGMTPMPYPLYGFEFSNGLPGHLTIRLRIRGAAAWMKDRVDLFIRELRLRPDSFDTLAWREDSAWTHVAHWRRDVAMNTDSDEGVTTWTLNV